MANTPPLSNKRRRTNNSPCDHTQEGMDEKNCLQFMPTQVAEIFISQLTDIKLLKLCRLVCKSWNHEACQGLRKRARVTLIEDDSDDEHGVEKFRSILEERSYPPFAVAPLPSPFNIMCITIDSFKKENFKNFVLQPFLTVTEVIVNMGELFDCKSLQEFLEAKMHQIESLEINADFKDEHWDMLDYKVRFPKLKSIYLVDECRNNNCAHQNFLKNSLEDSPLETANFKIKTCDGLLSLLQIKSVIRVKRMVINVGFITEENWNAFAEVRIPALETLELDFENHNDARQHTDKISKFVEGSAQSLRVLTVYCLFLGPPKTYVEFPKLSTIQVDFIRSSSLIAQISPDKFPLLNRVVLRFQTNQLSQLNQLFCPHGGVKDLCIRIREHEIHLLDTVFPTLMINLKNQFPNVVNFSLKLKTKWTPLFFQDIFNVYPKLKLLGIGGQIDFSTLAGSTLNNTKQWLQNGWDFKNMPRRNSIYDFKKLMFLSLPAMVTDEVFEYCLSKIPTLCNLDISWNPHGLTKTGLEIGLRNLEEIHIFDVEPELAAVRELAKDLPNIYVYDDLERPL